MKTFHINDLIALCKELICKQESLIEISTGVVPEVEQKSCHALLEQFLCSFRKLLVCCSCEFGQLDISCGVIDHESCIDTVYRNLVTHYLERYDRAVTIDSDSHLRA